MSDQGVALMLCPSEIHCCLWDRSAFFLGGGDYVGLWDEETTVVYDQGLLRCKHRIGKRSSIKTRLNTLRNSTRVVLPATRLEVLGCSAPTNRGASLEGVVLHVRNG